MQSFSTLGQTAALNANFQAAEIRQAPTLTSAISLTDVLNKRLEEVAARVTNIAQAIGGPFPVATGKHEGGGNPNAISAIQRLSDNIGSAHRKLTDIEDALSALQRTLGE